MTVYSSHSPRDGWLITSFKEGELGTERFRDSPNITQLVSVPESARTRASSTPTAGPAEKPRLSQSHLNRRDVNFDNPESSQAELWGWGGRSEGGAAPRPVGPDLQCAQSSHWVSGAPGLRSMP